MIVGVFGSEYQVEKESQIRRIFSKLEELEATVYVDALFANFIEDAFDFRPSISGLITDVLPQVDVVLSVGGDGTFLRTATRIGKLGIPILGINTGRLGFLADVSSYEIEDTLDELFKNYYKIEERTLLKVESQDHAISGYHYALNEVAILKRDSSSMITIRTFLNDDYLTDYQADGLVIATPTGSTAYSMSVNGPIILPQANTFVLSPVAPHSLNVRPLVIPDTYKITMDVESRSDHFLVALDGRSTVIRAGIEIKVSKAPFTTKVIKRYNHTFYMTLREKLMWGADNRNQ
ncbi:MAG TPA: NAD kinase [Porphyromonadaceae bacterium]|nr:NAD kinase [Porphyromonadaceae bacterium]